jgi:oligopeptide/dipeptide ABC transporter ATP-binding protein
LIDGQPLSDAPPLIDGPPLSDAPPLIEARGIVLNFAQRALLAFGTPRAPVQALRGIDLDIRSGEVLALVGESGSGKSTLARVLVRTIAASTGSIRFQGADITRLSGEALRALRRHFQVVFQDPFASLNPRRSVGAAIAEPLIVHGLARGAALRERVAECLSLVGLEPGDARRRPQEFSGGQRQRICIARAIAGKPRLIVADEALSALDPSLRDRMIELFEDLKQRYALTYLFISHDLGVVERIADRVAVMYLGRVVEIGPTHSLIAHPRHPYTQALLAAVPVPDPVAERARRPLPLAGEPPSPTRPPPGCAFHPRCTRAIDRCRREAPLLTAAGGGHAVACHRPD